MSISITKYVQITSGVAGAAAVANREFILRIFTTNPLVPPQSYLEFTSAADVATYFGSTSEEYLRAVFYFSFISKNITTPRKISFARWVNADVAPQIFGAKLTETLAQFKAITNGSFTLTIGGQANTFTGLDFSLATSLADVATDLQTKIRTGTGGAQWTSATVTYDATRGSFDFTGGATGAATITVTEGVAGTPIAALLGWLTGAILCNGSLTETITATLNTSSGLSNNFGSFIFTTASALDLAQITEAATWNNSQNIFFQYYVPVTLSNYASYVAALQNYAGVGLTLTPLANEYPEMFPAMILAATDYSKVNSVQNYMFQSVAGLTPSVTDDTTSNTLDAAGVNYYGQTQEAGQKISFYQRGVLMGASTAPLDMNTYANEQWLKDAALSALINLLLGIAKVSANTRGLIQITATLQAIINQALLNGTISVGKTLTTTQQLAITQLTNDENAWYQVQNNGYWFNVTITQQGSPVQYVAVYTLIYSKDDIIRSVQGTHVLI